MPKCSKCGKSLVDESPPFQVDDKDVCEECFAKAMGELVEKFPIGKHLEVK